MGMIRGTVYHRDSFVFKGNSYTGKLIFDSLPSGTRSVSLRLEDFVLEFGLYDVPERMVDLDFEFAVRDQVLEPTETAARWR
jgi:hypothetical protein